MARREDYLHHYHPKLHYASILPVTNHVNKYNDSRYARKSSDPDRSKALYVQFEAAFQDATTDQEYFGFQSSEQVQQNFNSQSIETISEVQNVNCIPYVRYKTSRETSHPSTPSDTPPVEPRHKNVRHYNHQVPPQLPPSSHHFLPNSNDFVNLHRDFTDLNLTQIYNTNELLSTFSHDAMKINPKQEEPLPNPSLQSKMTLPQYFLVKYLGRIQCNQLWGSIAVRAPIDSMIRNARQLSSMNDIPTLEACATARGLTLTHRHSSMRNRQHNSRERSPERHQYGLIPLENISYVMHDIKYSKVSSCIVLRQSKSLTPDHQTITETLTECYGFLFQSKEHAHRFALALAEAFNIQKQSSRNLRTNLDERRDARSPRKRSKSRHVQHRHERARTGTKYDEGRFGDSQV